MLMVKHVDAPHQIDGVGLLCQPSRGAGVYLQHQAAEDEHGGKLLHQIPESPKRITCLFITSQLV